jgi:aminomethyltransferase
MGPFAGWQVPISYEGILKEWEHVRLASGLFDISHMGRIFVSGEGALSFLNAMLTRNLYSLPKGKVAYALLLDEQGGILDDVTVYRIEGDLWFLCVNAAHEEVVFQHLRSFVPSGVRIERSEEYPIQLALQGPTAEEALLPFCNGHESTLRDLPYYGWTKLSLMGTTTLVSRTGYTGEDGFELYLKGRTQAEGFIDGLLRAKGRAFGGLCGFGVRDVLRLEAAYPLAGTDFDRQTTPLEAGLEFAINLEKPYFIGKEALVVRKQEGLKERRTGFIAATSRVPRGGYRVHVEGSSVGRVTSGTYSPFRQCGIAMGYMPTHLSSPGLDVLLTDAVRSAIPAKTSNLPFYPHQTKRKKG